MLSVWGLGSLILISIGIAGEYIGKIFVEVKARPRYAVKRKIMNEFDWAEEMNCAVTVCDNDGRDSISEQTGTRALRCSRQPRWQEPDSVPQRALAGHNTPYASTPGRAIPIRLRKKGVHKMIYQTPWRRDGKIAGLVEISMIIPDTPPHYIRDMKG